MVPRRASGFQAETLDGQVLLLHPAKSILVHSNETATLVWKLCDGQRSVDEIVAMLSAGYPDDTDSIRLEVPGILQSLAERGVIEWV